MKNKRFIISAVSFFAGLMLAAYGAGFHKVSVMPEKDDTATNLKEPAIVREVTIGGLALKNDGKIRQTYTGKPPEACPT